MKDITSQFADLRPRTDDLSPSTRQAIHEAVFKDVYRATEGPPVSVSANPARVPPSRSSRLVAAAAAVITLAGVGALVALAVTGGANSELTLSDGVSTTAVPRASASFKFPYAVSNPLATEHTRSVAVDESGVCYVVIDDIEQTPRCATLEAIAHGVAWEVLDVPDGHLIVGVVPDVVDVVEVNGRRIGVQTNLVSVLSAEPITSVRVGSSSTDQWVVAPILLSSPTTTTSATTEST